MSDRRVVDTLDGYSPSSNIPPSEIRSDAVTPARNTGEPWENLENLQALTDVVKLDGYQNRLTGIGDPGRDKTYGGRWNGPEFVNQFFTGWEAQERWRGSDLGGRIIETIPREMIRKGWTILVQPDPDDVSDAKTAGGKIDAFPMSDPTKAPSHKPGELPETSDDNTALVEALVKQQEHLGLSHELDLALCYERNYGGAGILLGVDDGAESLVSPLDWTKVRKINHITTFRGGWDGELIAWSYYIDPRDKKFGKPKIFQLRNLGVTINNPAPGEEPDPNPAPPLLFYVHESRLLLFDGDPKSRWAQVQMRGWGDGIWMRVNQILSQYCQSWEGVAILMQELGTPILKMTGFANFMSAQDGSGVQTVTARAIAMQQAMSIAKVRILDTLEDLDRLSTPLAGVPEILREFGLRISAASGMPFSMLMGQVQGGLGDASKGDISFFDDQIIGLQTKKLTPVLEKFVRLQFCAKEGPTHGEEPRRWSVTPNPQREMTAAERADYRNKIATADGTYIDKGVVTPEEVASTRFGGSEFNDGPIVLDLEARAKSAKAPDDDLDIDADPLGAPGEDTGDLGADPHTMPPVPTHEDSTEIVKRNGRSKIRVLVSKLACFRSDGKMLFGKRGDSGKYDVPGGHFEPGEDALSCAVRELWEETGLHATRLQYVGSKDLGDGLSHVRLSVFRALVDGEPTAANDPDKEFQAFEWFDVSRGYPEQLTRNLHYPVDVVGAILRRSKK